MFLNPYSIKQSQFFHCHLNIFQAPHLYLGDCLILYCLSLEPHYPNSNPSSSPSSSLGLENKQAL